VRLAVNYDPGWQPDAVADEWAVTVDGRTGRAYYEAPAPDVAMALAGPLVFLGGLGLIIWGRRKR
jgi:hypothetical protein